MIFEDHIQWPSEKQKGDYDKLKSELQAKIGHRWPVTIKYHPTKVKSIPDSDAVGGFRIEKPSGIRIGLQWTATGMDKKKHVYTYCDNYDPDPVTKKNKYTPIARNCDGAIIVTEDDIEFLMWMYLAYPGIEGGKNDQNKNMLAFDLPHLEKQKSNEYKTIYGKVLTLITSRETGLSMENLRKMATSYFIQGVDDMTDDEVMDTMERKVTEGDTPERKIEAMKLFLFREGNPEGLKVRFLCQRAIEKNFVEFNPQRRVWNVMEDGQPIDPPICKVSPTQDKFQVLHESMGGVPENREYLKMLETFLGVESEEKKVKETKKEK